MQSSVHTARWLNRLADTKNEILLFPPCVAPHHHTFKKLERLTSWARQPKPDGTVNLLSIWLFWVDAGRAERLVGELTRNSGWRVSWLTHAIKRLKPDVIHSLDFPVSGGLCVKAREEMGTAFPPWIATNWGADFSRLNVPIEHMQKIKERILRHADFYLAECNCDINVARELGFKGQALSALPSAGEFDLAAMRKYIGSCPKTSSRRMVAVNGFQHFTGRPLTALNAISLCANELRGFQVRVYSATPEIEFTVRLMAAEYDLDIQCMSSRMSTDDILKLQGSCRISLEIGVSNCISTSFLESLVLGSFPIQSNTACIGEWVADGESGFIVSPFRPEDIADRIKLALSDDALVDSGARINSETANTKLCRKAAKYAAGSIYNAIEKGQTVQSASRDFR